MVSYLVSLPPIQHRGRLAKELLRGVDALANGKAGDHSCTAVAEASALLLALSIQVRRGDPELSLGSCRSVLRAAAGACRWRAARTSGRAETNAALLVIASACEWGASHGSPE